jgi:hypothetical protein
MEKIGAINTQISLMSIFGKPKASTVHLIKQAVNMIPG